jgi:hypothetical protein
MGRDRIVEPDSERLYISDGDYIDVKKRLNHGEHDDYLARISPFQTPGEPVRMETRQIRTSKVLAYLIGWSLTHKCKPIPMSPDMSDKVRIDTLNSLDKETFGEIHAAIDAHEDKTDADAAAAKNGKGGATESPAISPSPVVVPGATSGSELLTETSTASSSNN